MRNGRSDRKAGRESGFEILVENMATRFINLPAKAVDKEIIGIQKKACQYFGFGRTVLWLFESGNINQTKISYMYSLPGYGVLDEDFSMNISCPWMFNQIRQGRTVSLKALGELPSKAATDLKSLNEMGVTSLICAPMKSEDGITGALSFCSFAGQQPLWDATQRRIQIVAQIFSNLLCLKYKEAEAQKLYRFETLISDISARFVNLSSIQLGDQIERAQKVICHALDIELSALWLWSDTSPHYLTVTHLYTPPYGPEKPEGIKAEESFPWTLERLKKGETLTIYTEDMPQEAKTDKASREGFGIQSSVVLPLCSGDDTLIGVLSFDAIRHKKQWSEAIIDRLTLLGQIFTSALVRKRQEYKLRENEKRLRMATKAGEIGLWVMDIDSGHVWATQRTREIFQFGAHQSLNYDSFMDNIIEEDRVRVNRTVKKAINGTDAFEVEYRILHADGSICWVRAGGKAYCDAGGQPKQLMGSTIDINRQKTMEMQLQSQLDEIQALKQKLEKKNAYLHRKIEVQFLHDEIIARSRKMHHVLSQVEQVAQTDATVLIQGETGTGKELIARAIHRLSRRKDRPLVTINCASLPPTLVESELFGREKGAYTGALTKMAGRFEIADKATLFLDEVGELPMEIQAKLLRVLEQEKFERLGSARTIHVDVRIIAATNQDLEKMVDEGKFRKDLYFRLNIFPIHIPPLRDRRDDVPPLTWSFVREFEKKMAKRIDNIPRESMTALQHYHWPGNIRELRNIIERTFIMSNSRTLNVVPPPSDNNTAERDETLEKIERNHIFSVLEKTQWRISGSGSASEVLGLKRTTLQSKMKKLGIHRPKKNRR